MELPPQKAPFPDPASLTVTRRLLADYPAIREEAVRLRAAPLLKLWQPYIEDEAQDGLWEVLPLCGGGLRSERVLRLCPATSRVLAQVPHLRQALFSSLGPGTIVKPHRGAAGILRVHLGLLAEPGAAGWRVDGATRECVEGEVVIFEDGCLHEAWNHGTSPRITLLFDTPVPSLDAEQTRQVLQAYDEQMRGGRQAALARKDP